MNILRRSTVPPPQSQQARRTASQASSKPGEQQTRRAASQANSKPGEQQAIRAASQAIRKSGEQQSRRAASQANSQSVEQKARRTTTRRTSSNVRCVTVPEVPHQYCVNFQSKQYNIHFNTKKNRRVLSSNYLPPFFWQESAVVSWETIETFLLRAK